VADQLVELAATGASACVPPDDQIRIDVAGCVTFHRVQRRNDPCDAVAELAGLLRRLLALDSAARIGVVPGSLMVLMARSLGEIDLPKPTLAAFRDALNRVAGDATDIRAQLVATRTASMEAPSVPVRRAAQWRFAAVAFATGLLTTFAITSTHPSLFHRSHNAVIPLTSARRPPTSAPARPAPPPRSAPVHPSVQATGGRPSSRLLLADVAGMEPFSPSFSPDGRAIYFHAGRITGRLMRADLAADGTVSRVQPLLTDGASDFHVVVSPDGSAVAFDSDRDGIRAVYVANSDGTRIRRVSGAGFATVPTWSPDGRRLAFIKAGADPRVWNVWVADLQTLLLHQVSDHRVGQAWGASWFPDGHRLAYSVEDRLVVTDLVSGRRTIVRSPRAGHLVRTPAVSPDGRRVVFQVHGDGAWMLNVANGRVSRVLTDRSAEEFHWSPDGRRIAYHARAGRRWGVWTLGAVS
jgi:hypothetical protein